MADDKDSGGGLGGNNVILFLIAAVSAAYVGWHSLSLVSNRPSEQDIGKHPIVAAQDIDARLWQDPFTAVEKDDQASLQSLKKDDEPHSLDHVFLNYTPGSRVLALAVALPGDPYPESAETRRRLRYAVLAGLHEEGYVPTDEKHIGDWLIGPESATIGTPVDGIVAALPPSIPFEWFKKEATAPSEKKSILVLWLDEDFMTATHRPIASLEGIECLVQQKVPSLKFVFLGPQDSTTLMTMIQEAYPPLFVCVNLPWSIYNFSASADEKEVLALAGIPSNKKLNKDIFRNKHITYYRTITSDRDLSDTLRKELELRGLITGQEVLDVAMKWGGGGEDEVAEALGVSGPGHIALISEWDTVYGELLPKTVKEVFAGTKDGKVDNAQDQRIRRYSYLRGLDGLAADRKRIQSKPKSPDDDDNQQKSPDQGATPDTASNFEGAEGQSQYDYLYRLADRLDQWDEDLRRDGEGKIDAVGVLGSDVYDKLPILQALRPKFPEAVFFTTDLDALLLPQGKSHYTRGLLVASAYGLRLRKKLQGDIPPFRSSYETSAFLATQLSVNTEMNSQKGNSVAQDPAPQTHRDVENALDRWSQQPLLFQIGLTAARELAVGSSPADSQSGKTTTDKACGTADLTKCDTVQPHVPPLFPKFSSKEKVGFFLFPAVLCTLIFIFPQIREVCFHGIGPQSTNLSEDSITGFVLPRLFIGFLLTFWIRMFLFWDDWVQLLTDGSRGEPMTLFEGISIWPTIVLRAFGIVLSLFLIWYTLRNLEMNRYEVGKEFDVWNRSLKFSEIWQYLKGTPQTLPDAGNPLRSNTCLKERIRSIGWFPRINTYNDLLGMDDFGRKKIWFSWITAGGYSNAWYIRAGRVSVYTILMFGVWWLILTPIFGEPYAPTRGARTSHIYFYTTIIDVIVTLFLVFLVVDATLYSYAFIKRLTEISTEWPQTTFARYMHRFKLRNRDGLSDFIDMKYLEGRTQCIAQLVYFPFIALAMLMLSRNWLFDDFSMPPILLIAQGICVVAIVASVMAYRSAAEDARRKARWHLTARITAAKRNEKTSPHAEQLEMMLVEIDKLNEGAFAPLTSQPIVKAVLLPLITYGGAWLLHLYALPGN